MALHPPFQRPRRALDRRRGQRRADRSLPGCKRSSPDQDSRNERAGLSASLLIGLLLAVTAFGLARPLADFLVGRSLRSPLLEKLEAIVREDPAIEKILSLRTIYTGPEEVVVAAKIHPSAKLNIEQLTRAMDDLDIRIRTALPIVADVFIDVTASRAEDKSRAP